MAMSPVSFGVLGASRFAITRTIPAMLEGQWTRIEAIASRDLKKAQETARQFGIPRAYGSYEELLADQDLEAVYNPLPISMHVDWSTKAAEAGKHVLCEKAISATAAEAEQLPAVMQRTGKLIMEAFMVRCHPRWHKARELIRGGRIGQLKAIEAYTGFNNLDPQNIRNRKETAGGGLLDIGCYAVTTSRFITEREPTRVICTMERDPGSGVDTFCAAILDFGDIRAIFNCGTRSTPQQHMTLHGTEGVMDVPLMITPPPELPSELRIKQGPQPWEVETETVTVDAVNQYTIQGDRFCESIREGKPLPVPMSDSIANMKVLDALFRSADSGNWETP